MKVLPGVFLAIVLVITMLLGGCSASNSTTTSAATTASASTAAAAATATTAQAAGTTAAAASGEVITLRYADANSRTGWYGQHTMLPWIESMEEATNGRVKFEIYDSETLLKSPATWTGVATGVADVGWAVHVVLPGKFPVGSVISLPLLPLTSAEQSTAVFWKLYEKYPALQEEYKDVHVLGISASEPYFLLNNKRAVETMSDMSGLKIRVSAGAQTEMMQAMGASPMSMSFSEIYLNLQKGVLDGLATPWEGVYSWKLYEVANYYTYVPLLCNNACRIMNLDTWNSLPADIQQAISTANDVEASKTWGRTQFDDITKFAREEVKGKGYDMVEYTLPQDELDKWRETVAKPIWEKWVSDTEAAGHPEARDILNDLLAFAEETK